MEQRRCQYCNKLKDIDQFYVEKSDHSHIHVYCKDCVNRDEPEGKKVMLASKKFYTEDKVGDDPVRENNERIKSKVKKASKIVLQRCKTTGEVLNEFATVTVASEELGLGIAVIRKCLRGDMQTAHGFLWKFKE